jgi:hypothetical protein
MKLRIAASSAVIAAIAFAAPPAHAEPRHVTEPDVHPTPLWLAMQLLPSPETAFGDGSARFGLRRQITPLLYSFGINRRLSPWRFFVVEPFVRQSGSIEAFFSPEYIALGGDFWNRVLFRSGVRSYFPIVAKGEYLSVSVAASYVGIHDGPSGAAIEGGIYALFGVVGAQLTYSPSFRAAEWIATLRVRYF